MFGYLRTNRDLTLRDYDTYRAYYCGLCHALGREYGLLARALNNFEGTFLALLVDAQSETPLELMRSTCVASPFSLRRAVAQKPALEFAAAATVCGVNAKLQDDIADGDAGRIVRLVTWLGRSRVRAAQEKVRDLGFPLEVIEHQWVAQRALEAAGDLGLERAVEPSAKAYAAIVAHTARLAGRPENEGPLDRLGYELGKVTCLLDSYLDYPMDVRLHRFNVLQACLDVGPAGGTIRDLPSELAAEVRRSIWSSLQAIESRLDQTAWSRHAGIIRNVLVHSLRETAQRVLVEEDASALDATPKVLGFPLRALVHSPALAAAVIPVLMLSRRSPGSAVQGFGGDLEDWCEWCCECCCLEVNVEQCCCGLQPPQWCADRAPEWANCVDPLLEQCDCANCIDSALEQCGCGVTDCGIPDCGTSDCGNCAIPDCGSQVEAPVHEAVGRRE